ncbi:MAG: NUDIX domain-containing protein [Planctomycetota bacterium]
MTDDLESRGESGYRIEPGRGPRLRSDVIDCYVFRRTGEGGIEFLQMRRAGKPLAGTWQPVMGHIEAEERAWETAVRELGEEISLEVSSEACLGMWALEQVYPYYLADLDAIVLSPRFACEVEAGFEPKLNEEHTDWRWVRDASDFMWPGQQHAVSEIESAIAPVEAPARQGLRLRLT